MNLLLLEQQPSPALERTFSHSHQGLGDVTRVAGLDAALDALTSKRFDVVLLNLAGGGQAASDRIWVLRQEAPQVPLIVITESDDPDLGFQIVQAGAQDYLAQAEVSERTLLRAMRLAVARQQALNEAMTLSFLDVLTGLHNRRGFLTLAEHQLRIAQRGRRPLLLLFMDIDGLKAINDLLGHQHGDAALAEVAAVLRETFRDTDLVARIGGDEFTVLALEASADTSAVLQERLLDRLAIHNLGEGRDYFLSISIGVAHFDPVRPTALDELLNKADKSMYRQKSRKHDRGLLATRRPRP